MKIKDLTEDYWQGIDRELMDGFENLNDKMEVFIVDTPNKPSKVSQDNQEFKSPIASQVRHIFDFVTGQGKVDHLADIIESCCELVWVNPFIQQYNYNINWEEWKKTKFGFLVYLGKQRLKLERGNDFSARELADLAGLTNAGITHKIPEEIKAKKVGRSWVIPNKEAIKFIKNRNEKYLLEFYGNISY